MIDGRYGAVVTVHTLEAQEKQGAKASTRERHHASVATAVEQYRCVYFRNFCWKRELWHDTLSAFHMHSIPGQCPPRPFEFLRPYQSSIQTTDRDITF
jgi:hypothetical protein